MVTYIIKLIDTHIQNNRPVSNFVDRKELGK